MCVYHFKYLGANKGHGGGRIFQERGDRVQNDKGIIGDNVTGRLKWGWGWEDRVEDGI